MFFWYQLTRVVLDKWLSVWLLLFVAKVVIVTLSERFQV